MDSFEVKSRGPSICDRAALPVDLWVPPVSTCRSRNLFPGARPPEWPQPFYLQDLEPDQHADLAGLGELLLLFVDLFGQMGIKLDDIVEIGHARSALRRLCDGSARAQPRSRRLASFCVEARDSGAGILRTRTPSGSVLLPAYPATHRGPPRSQKTYVSLKNLSRKPLSSTTESLCQMSSSLAAMRLGG